MKLLKEIVKITNLTKIFSVSPLELQRPLKLPWVVLLLRTRVVLLYYCYGPVVSEFIDIKTGGILLSESLFNEGQFVTTLLY